MKYSLTQSAEFFFKMIRNIIDQKDACYTSYTCKCIMLCRLIFLCNVGIRLRKSVILHGQISLRSSSRSTVEGTGLEIYSTWYSNSVRSLSISQEKQIGFEFAFKTKGNLCNAVHFWFEPSFVLQSDHNFLPSFKSAIKRYFTLLSGFIYIECSFVYHQIASFY